MASVSVAALRENLVEVARNVPDPQWDFIVYCRFLAKRLPETQEIEASAFGRLAGELVADLREGVDRTTGQTFVPPLVSGRSDLLYDYLRNQLQKVAEKVGGAEFARAAETTAAAAAAATAATVAAGAPGAATPAAAAPGAATPAAAAPGAAVPPGGDAAPPPTTPPAPPAPPPAAG
jgi:hypothetical protein